MAYLNCPFCPAQAFPVLAQHLWVGGYKAFQPLNKYICSSNHIFYVEEEDINGRIKSFQESSPDGNHWISHELTAITINTLAGVCRLEADKWYHNPITGELLFLNHGERFALMHSEISEAMEAYRTSEMSTKLPGFTGTEEELADALIRILDYCGDNNLRIGEAFVAKLGYNKTRRDHTNAARLSQGGKKF